MIKTAKLPRKQRNGLTEPIKQFQMKHGEVYLQIPSLVLGLIYE